MVTPVNVLALPRLNPARERINLTVPHGATVGEIVALAVPGVRENDRKQIRVTIGEWEIIPRWWDLTKPKAGTQVVIRVIPGNDNLRTILTLVAVVAAAAIGQFYLGPLIAGAVGASGFGVTAITSFTSVALPCGGGLGLNVMLRGNPQR